MRAQTDVQERDLLVSDLNRLKGTLEEEVSVARWVQTPRLEPSPQPRLFSVSVTGVGGWCLSNPGGRGVVCVGAPWGNVLRFGAWMFKTGLATFH